MIWCTKYRKKILRGRIAERVRDLIRQTCAARRGVDYQRRGVAGSHSSAAVGTADPGSAETGARYRRAIVKADADGVSGIEETILGAAHVGARLLLRDGGSGKRGNDQGLYRGRTLLMASVTRSSASSFHWRWGIGAASPMILKSRSHVPALTVSSPGNMAFQKLFNRDFILERCLEPDDRKLEPPAGIEPATC